MNRGFRKKYMRLTALLLSVAVVSGSMDTHMLYVHAAQEQGVYAEDAEGTVPGGDMNQDSLYVEEEHDGLDADDADTDERQDDAGSQDGIGSGDDGAQQDDGKSGDGAGSQNSEKPGNDAGLEDGADTSDAADGQEEENDEDAGTVSDNNVNSPLPPSDVKVQAEDDTNPAPEGPVKVGGTISGIAIADKIYDGNPSSYSGNPTVTAKIGEKGSEEDVTSSAHLSYFISGVTTAGTDYDENPDTIAAGMPKDAGIYTLKVTASYKDDNYIYEGSQEYKFTISKRTITVRAKDKEIKITDAVPKKFAYLYSGFEDGEAGEEDEDTDIAKSRFLTKPTVSCEAGEKNFGIPGQYSITITGGDAGPNYRIVHQNGTLTILGKELATISGFRIATDEYDGKPREIECTDKNVGLKVFGGTDDTGVRASIEYEYSIYGIDESGDEYRRSGIIPANTDGTEDISKDMPTDAGRYKFKIKVPSNNDGYKGNWQYDFEITRKKITITADDIQIKKGAGFPRFTYKVDGFVNGDDPFGEDSGEGDSTVGDEGKPRAPKLTCSAKDTSTPGQYAIVPSGAFAGANYSIEYTPGTLTILDDEAITLSGIETINKIYDRDPVEFKKLAPEVLVDGKPAADVEYEYSISGTLADADGTKYTSKGDMKDPANRPIYTGQYVLEVRVLQVTKSTDGDSPAGKDADGDSSAGDGSDGDNSDSSGGGQETVTKKEIFRQDYPFTITPRPISVTVKDREITAGDTLPVPAEDEEWYEVGGFGFLDGEGFVTEPKFECSLEDTETPGTYPITASGADAGYNYTITYVSGTLTIVEKEVVKTRELVRIVAPNPVFNIKNGTPLDAIELPETVYIKTKEITGQDGSSEEGSSLEWTQKVDVEWERRAAEGTSYSPGTKTAQNFILHGTAVLPADVDAGKVSTVVRIEVSVREEITSREQVKNPTASVPTGTAVRRGTKITLSCETEGAEIYYTLDDKNPPTKEKGLRYTFPIEVSKYTVIWACAYKDGCPESEIVKFSYYIDSSIVGPGGDDDTEGPEVPKEDIPSDGRIPSGLWVTENAVGDYIYTGKAIKPVVRVYDYKTLLVEKKDYTISYKNNVNAADKNDSPKPPTITITGKGNYKGKLTRKFTILPKNIGDPDVSVDDITLAYNANKPKAQKPSPIVMWNGKKLTNKKDYTVPDESYTDVGTRGITVTGRGNYTGTKSFSFTITDGILMSGLTVSKIPNQVYTGAEIEPQPEVKYKGELLILNQNYTLDWDNNKDVGTAAVIIKGMPGGRYVGTKKVTFKITAVASLKKAKVELETESIPYTGQEVKVDARSVTLKVGGEERSLSKGADYEVSYQNNVKAGKATVVFTGKGAYNGQIKKTFKITPLNIGESAVSLSTSYNYEKGGVKPEPKVMYRNQVLKLGTDYTLSYKQNNAAGSVATVTVKGKGNFSGSTSKTFTVTPQAISKVTVTASDKIYKNKKNIYKTTVRLTDTDGKALSAGSDYDKNMKYTYAYDVKDTDGKVIKAAGTEVDKEDIIPAGTTIKVEITAKGSNYTGTVSGTYRIAASNISRAKATIPSMSYTGKEIKPDSQIDVSVDGAKLSLNTDYEIVGYSNNVKKGTAKVVIHGLGSYGGTKTVSFKIVSKALGD